MSLKLFSTHVLPILVLTVLKVSIELIISSRERETDRQTYRERERERERERFMLYKGIRKRWN